MASQIIGKFLLVSKNDRVVSAGATVLRWSPSGTGPQMFFSGPSSTLPGERLRLGLGIQYLYKTIFNWPNPGSCTLLLMVRMT